MSFAAKVGLGVAVEECVRLGIGRIWAQIQHLAALLRAGLAEVPGCTLHDHGRLLCGLVSFTLQGWTGEWLEGRPAGGVAGAGAHSCKPRHGSG